MGDAEREDGKRKAEGGDCRECSAALVPVGQGSLDQEEFFSFLSACVRADGRRCKALQA